MKRGSKLLVLCGTLAALGACYLGVRQLSADPDAGSADIALPVPQSPARLSWTDGGGTLTLENRDGGWVWADDAAFPLDQDVPEQMVSALTSATASRKLDAPASLADYGLEEPALTITALDEDGTEYSYSFGSVNEMTGEYYMLSGGDSGSVYLVGTQLHDVFSKDLYDMVEMETLPEFGAVTALSVEQPDGSLSLRYEENSAGLSYRTDQHWFLDRDGTLLALDAGKVSSLTSCITGLYWQSCVSYDADAEKLAAWGLDGSAAVVTVSYTPAAAEGETAAGTDTFTLRLGNSDENGAYAMLEGSSMVYTISADTADSLRYASYASLRSDNLCTMDWDTVDRLDITLGGTVYTISFDETETQADGEAEAGTRYTWNGQELDGAAVESLLSAVNSLAATGDAAGTAGGETLVSFTFHRSTEDDFAELTLTLSALDTGSCLASFTGEGSRLVERSAVNDLTDQIAELFS